MDSTNLTRPLVVMGFCLQYFLSGCSSAEGGNQSKPPYLPKDSATTEVAAAAAPAATAAPEEKTVQLSPVDTAKYAQLKNYLCHDSTCERWPVKDPIPLPGAILPFHRIIAFYGNFYSTRMGILGELPPDQMIAKLKGEVKKWEEADPKIPVMPAVHYIAVTAQGAPGQSGKYRMRMPAAQIDKAVELAKQVNGIVFLDVQVGWSTLQDELPELEKYLKMPQVHLGIDPEFSMKSTGRKPGTIIGTFDAEDINWASAYLTRLVKENNLPPKILVVHRFTRGMVTNYQNIKLHPEVQIISHMDGWGFPAKKVSSYQIAQVTQPVQFTGFKLFYKNDIKTPPWTQIMTPDKVLKLYPSPIYIQYQ
jgi:hypothetical protein